MTTKDKRKKIRTAELPAARRTYLAKIKRDKIKVVTIQIAILVLFLGLWQLLAST